MRGHAPTIGALSIVGLLGASALAFQAPNVPSDDQIRSEVEQRLLYRKISGILVTVSQGAVTIEGKAVSLGVKNEACQQPRGVPGVTRVTCEVTVLRGPSDQAIALEVENRVIDYAFYTIFDSVDAAVKNGRVTLIGEVMADVRGRAIADIAARVPGVVEVNNLLRTLVASPKDDDIRYEIAGGIYSNPVFYYDEAPGPVTGPVHIVVESGRVKLTGWVPSEAERRMAEMIASMVPGVVRVENRLRCAIDG